MKFIRQRLAGHLLVEDGLTALRLSAEQEPVVYVAFALVTQGIAAQIIPRVLLDDWGTEIKGLGLYTWVRDNGLRFPRAETFGFSPAGEPVQYFLRDMELFAPYPLYAATDRELPVYEWQAVHALLIPDDTVTAPEAAAAPEAMPLPLREARAVWWRVPPWQDDLDFLRARDLPFM